MLSAPSEHVTHPQVSAPEAAPEHRGLLTVEEGHGGGRGWASIEPTRVAALPVARDEGPAVGERGCGGVLPFGPHSTMARCALSVQASSTSIPFAELLPPSRPRRMSPRGQPQSSAWVCSPKPTFQRPALVCSGGHPWGGHPLRLGGQGRAQHPICRSHCPAATRRSPCSLPQRVKLSFCPNWAPPESGCHGCGHLFSLQIPPSLQVPSQFLSSSFSFFSGPTWLSRNLSCPFWWWRFFASVQRGLCENCSNSDVFLMHLWREMNSNLPNPLACWSLGSHFL